ncbi:MAG: glycosyltransferase [Geodermatophilaceae bacterium]
MRVAVIASSRFPISEPFAGGLESHVWHLTRQLKRRGHRVTLFAAPGSDRELSANCLSVSRLVLGRQARADVSMPPLVAMEEHHAYLGLMLELMGDRANEFDLVHNHSLHYLPIAMAPALRTPMVSTLHTPPTPWLESAMQIGPKSNIRFVAVSAHTARAWRHTAGPVTVVPNGVDVSLWRPGPGGGPLIWSGRIVREKGVDLAIAAAALAGMPLQVAGPIVDRAYYDEEVAPHLGTGVTYLGHLSQRELAVAVGRAGAALVTPRWNEPYGLVVAEALACGTPVAAFSRGGIPEIVTSDSGRLVAADDVAALAAVIPTVLGLSRQAARARAVTACSLETMIARYEVIYREVLGTAAAQAS